MFWRLLCSGNCLSLSLSELTLTAFNRPPDLAMVSRAKVRLANFARVKGSYRADIVIDGLPHWSTNSEKPLPGNLQQGICLVCAVTERLPTQIVHLSK